MSKILLIVGALPWLLIFLHQIFRRGFAVLLIWLLIAPVATNLLQRIDQEVYQTAGTEKSIDESDFYYETPASVTLLKLLNPNRTLFTLLLVIFVLNALLKKTRWVPLDKTEKWMIIFSVILLSNVFLRSGRTGFGLTVAVDALIVPFVAYYVTRRLVNSEDRFHQLIRVIGYLGIWIIIYSLIDRFTHSDLSYRIQGPFAGRDHLYITMAVIFFAVSLDLFSNRDPNAQKRALPPTVGWFLITLAPVIILLTLTRGNWLGFLAGFLVILFLVRRWVNFSTKSGLLALATLGTVIVFSLLSFAPEEFFEDRLTDVGNIEGRFATWIAVLKIIEGSPLFGIGLNNLMGELSKVRIDFGEAANYTTAHNSFLALTAELGAIGTIAYLMIQVSIVRMGLRIYQRGRRLDDRWRGAAVIAIMVSYHVASLFEHIIYHSTVAHVYVYVLVGAIAGLYGSRESVAARSPLLNHYRRVITREPIPRSP